MVRVFLIIAKDEVELVRKINEETREFFATQLIQKQDGTWVCFLYQGKNKIIEEPATEKQIDYLNYLKIKIPEGLTKREAIKLIEEKKNGGAYV